MTFNFKNESQLIIKEEFSVMCNKKILLYNYYIIVIVIIKKKYLTYLRSLFFKLKKYFFDEQIYIYIYRQ